MKNKFANWKTKRIGFLPLVTFVAIYSFGCGLRHKVINPIVEPFTIQYFYKNMQVDETPPIRFIDLGPLYDSIGKEYDGYLPQETIQQVCEAIANLDERHRPTVVGFDVPAFQNGLALKSKDGSKSIVQTMLWLETKGIAVRIGYPDLELRRPELDGLIPNYKKYFGTVILSKSPEQTFAKLGTDNSAFVIQPLGITTFAAKLKGETREEFRFELMSYATNSPSWWPTFAPDASTWIFVNHSILKRAAELSAGIGLSPSDDLPDNDLNARPKSLIFSPEDIKKLEHNGSDAMYWIIGNAHVNEELDTAVYDPETGWISEQRPIRRMYQHGSIIYSCLHPIMFVHGWKEECFDLPLTLLGFWFARNGTPGEIRKWVKQKVCNLLSHLGFKRVPKIVTSAQSIAKSIVNKATSMPRAKISIDWLKTQRIKFSQSDTRAHLSKILRSMLLVLITFVISYGLLQRGILWFGFVASSFYFLFEIVIAPIFGHE